MELSRNTAWISRVSIRLDVNYFVIIKNMYQMIPELKEREKDNAYTNKKQLNFNNQFSILLLNFLEIKSLPTD